MEAFGNGSCVGHRDLLLRITLRQSVPDNDCGNAVAAKRFSIQNPRERQLAFTALLYGVL